MSETKRILVIEDDASLASLLQVILQQRGYDVDIADDGALGLTKIRAAQQHTPYDVLLLDYILPSLDGLGVLRELSKLSAPPQVIMLTGQGNEGTALEAMKLGAADFIIKDSGQFFIASLSQSLEHTLARGDSVIKTLRSQLHLLDNILQSSPSVIYIYDLIEQRNIYANRDLFTVLGYTDKEVQAMGSSIFPTLMHPDDFALINQRNLRFAALKEGDIIETDYRMKHKNGEWRWLYSRDTVFTRLPEGVPKQIVGSAQDITERKLAEQDKERLIAELQAALDKVKNLEDIVTMCAWTGQVQYDGKWIRIEAYLEKRFGVNVSHGISDKAAAKMRGEIDRAKQEKSDSKP
jgi:PAS domain S-box-containing protein